MKRQDVSGQNTLHTDATGGAGTDVNIASVGGTPVTDPLPVSIASVPGDVTVVQPTAADLNATVVGTGTFAVQATISAGTAVIGHVITDTGSTTAVTGNVTVVQGTGTNLHTVVDSGTVTATIGAGTALIGQVAASNETSTIYNGTTALTPKFAKVAASSSGDNTIVAAVPLKKIRVVGYNLFANGTVNAKWQSGAGGTDLTGLKYFVANTGISVSYSPVGWFETASGALLNLNLSAGVAVGGEITYVEV